MSKQRIKLEKIFDEYLAFILIINVPFEEWLSVEKFPVQVSPYLMLAIECGFVSTAECKRNVEIVKQNRLVTV